MTAFGHQNRKSQAVASAALFAAALCGAVALGQAESGTDETAWQSYRAHVAAAQAWLELNEPGRAREWIEGAPAAFRGWEWRHLKSRLDSSLSTALQDDAGFMGVSIAPDGKLAACLAGNGRLSIISLPEAALVRSWDAHPQGGGFTVRFSPDGARVASSGADRLVKIWDTVSGELKLTFDKHKFPVGGLSWSPDGKRIASSAYYLDQETPIEGRVHIWDAGDGSVVHTLKSGRKPVVCTDWSGDGRYVAAGTWDSEAVVWSATDGALVRTINEKPAEDSSSHVDAISLSPDGQWVAYGSDRKWVRVYRVDSGERVAELLSHGQPISAVQFSRDGARLATGAGDDAIRVWDTATWKETGTFRGHNGRVRGLAFGPDGSRLYSASLDGTVRVWDPSVRDTGGLRIAHGTGNYSVSFSPDGALVAGAGYDGTVPVWDTRTAALRASWPAHAPQPVCMTDWSPDRTKLATCSWDKTARVFDFEARKELLKIEHAKGVGYVAWSPAGNLLATACNDGKAYLWNADSGSLVRSLEGHEGVVNEARFSPDAKFLVTSGGDKTARVWEVASGTCLRVLRGHTGGVLSACWSPSGAQIATSSQDGSVRLWNATTGEPARVAHQGDEPIYRVAFSPDGSRLACAGREVVLIDPARTGVAARLRSHEDMVWNVEWSPDGARLATGSWDGTVAILDRGKGDESN